MSDKKTPWPEELDGWEWPNDKLPGHPVGASRTPRMGELIDDVEWPEQLSIASKYRTHEDQTAINREMPAYRDKFIPLHLMSMTKFTEFTWRHGDMIMFEEHLHDYQPIAWRVDGDEWVRIKWEIGDEKYRRAISARVIESAIKTDFLRSLFAGRDGFSYRPIFSPIDMMVRLDVKQ